jgi:PAS domain S-box-containing protein
MLSRDITQTKENEAVLQMQAERAKALLNLPDIADQMDEKSFMQRGQEIAENLTGSEISFIHFVNKGGEEIELVAWSRRTLENYCTAAYDAHYPLSRSGIWADALRKGKPVVFNDYASYPHKHGLQEGHSPLQRLISVPIIENGQVVMMTGVGNKKMDYTELDVETVQLISHEIWHIVQRNRTRKKLTRLGRALDQSKYEIYILDPQTWLFMDANQGALDKIGYSLQELVQMTPLDLKPELTHESYAALLAPLLSAEQENTRFITHHRCKDGTLYPVEVHLEMTHDESPLLMQIVLDITELKQAEEDMRHAEARFRAIIEASPIPFALNDSALNIPYLNSAFIQTFGYDREDIPTVEAWWPKAYPDEMYRQEVIKEWSLRLEVAMRNAKPFEPMEVKIRCKDGSERTVLVMTTPLVSSFDDLHVVTLFDITERKKSDSLMHEQLGELHRWQQTMLGREDRIIKVKQEVNELLVQLGQPPRYTSIQNEVSGK